MHLRYVAGWLAVMLVLAAGIRSAPAAPAQRPVWQLTVDGAIGPATDDYVRRGLDRAAAGGAQLVVLRIDTPGGLDTSMRSIVKAILASAVPVAAYVGPGGARAASAGTYILYASHIAAMAPGTNLGAATPVAIGPAGDGERKGGDTLSPAERKQVNDAVAYIRGLAALRGRNAEWAEQAVRTGASLPASDALRLHATDYLAADVPALLAQIDGRTVPVAGGAVVLHTADATTIRDDPDWRTGFLAAVTHPGIALILLSIGIYGLLFEFMTPGMVLPGVMGGICVLLSLYALQLLPVNYAGLALVLLGLAFMIGELFMPSFGALGVGGATAFVVGALILIDVDAPGFGMPVGLIVAFAAANAAAVAALGVFAVRARRRQLVSGDADLVGATGEVVSLDAAGRSGWALVHGANWRIAGDARLQGAHRIRVMKRNGLVLDVEPVDNQQGEQP